jgi:hypothetical protein
MHKFDRIVEDAILKAIEEGKFDNLEGVGKPIIWKDNPYSSSEMRLVDDLLKKNDLSYPWMEKRKEIEKQIIELKEQLKDKKRLSKQDVKSFSEQIATINKKIFDYNLSVPVDRLQRRLLTVAELLTEVEN